MYIYKGHFGNHLISRDTEDLQQNVVGHEKTQCGSPEDPTFALFSSFTFGDFI